MESTSTNHQPEMVSVHAIEFDPSTRFGAIMNWASELYWKWAALPEGEEKDAAWEAYFSAKFMIDSGQY